MVGPHDLGGRKGHGTIRIVPDEPPFAAVWQGGVVGLTITTMARGLFGVDAWRARQEELHPLTYHRLGYFERWLYSVERCLIGAGVLGEAEIERRVQELAGEPGFPWPEHEDPDFVSAIATLIAEGAPIVQEVAEPPRFALGDRVRLRRIPIHRPGEQHTRLPGYAQGKSGEVVRLNAAQNLPDLMVQRGQARPEHTYSVRLLATDLWADGEPGATVCVDVWESYIEPPA